MKVLLTNDDGIDAPGLMALERVFAKIADVTVVAPLEHLSGCSHQATTDRPISLSQRESRRHALSGTPVDCVRLGLSHVAPDTDWVVAGINEGGNLGIDVYLSGTVAAAREAAILGKPAIAFSQYRGPEKQIDWDLAARQAERVAPQLLSASLAAGAFWNVNFPDTEGQNGTLDVIYCPLDLCALPIQYEIKADQFLYRGNYHERQRKAGTDVDVCFSGSVSITELRVG